IFFSPEMRSSTLATICERVFATESLRRSRSEPPPCFGSSSFFFPKMENIDISRGRGESNILTERNEDNWGRCTVGVGNEKKAYGPSFRYTDFSGSIPLSPIEVGTSVGESFNFSLPATTRLSADLRGHAQPRRGIITGRLLLL